MKLVKVLTANLTKSALNWAVAQASAINVTIVSLNVYPHLIRNTLTGKNYDPSSDGEAAMCIMVMERISVNFIGFDDVDAALQIWEAEHYSSGLTMQAYSPTEAVLRCLVASFIGFEVEVPCELLTDDDFAIDVLNKLWDDLGNIPTVYEGENVDEIEETFLQFPIGTHREVIWHWFESMNPAFLVGEKMSGK